MTEVEWLSSSDPEAMLSLIDTVWPHLSKQAKDRKLRLFAVACCRQVWHLLTDDAPCGQCEGRGRVEQTRHGYLICPNCDGTGRINRSRRAVEVAERYADGAEFIANAYEAAWHDALVAHQNMLPRTEKNREIVNAAYNASQVLYRDGFPIEIAKWMLSEPECVSPQIAAALLRDIFGNPFRPLPQLRQIVRTAKDMSAAALESGASEEVVWQHPWITWNNGTAPRLAQRIYDERAFDRMPILGDALQDAGCDDTGIQDHCRLHSTHVRGCWVIDLILGMI